MRVSPMLPCGPLAVALTLAAPATADVAAAVAGTLDPGLAAFADATTALADDAAEDCTAASLDPAYQAAWDAWAAIGDIRLGPLEAAALTVAFWPDERGATGRSLRGLIAIEDPAGRDPAAYAQQSAAARGLAALDHLLGDPELNGYAPGSYTCALVQTVAADLAAQASVLASAWPEEAAALSSAGAPGNLRYLTGDEAFRALYTQVLGALEFAADTRLGRPMGEPDRPRPTRAEGWRTGRPLPNVRIGVATAAALARALADGPTPATDAALDAVNRAADAIGDGSFQDADDPQARLKLEILQSRIRALRDAIEAEVGAPRGIAAGFNAQDGD